MATHNIVPNSDNTGKLGKPGKRWSEGHFATALTLDSQNVVTDAPDDGNAYSRLHGEWTLNSANTYTASGVTTGITPVVLSFENPPAAFLPGETRQINIKIIGYNITDDSSATWDFIVNAQRRLGGPMVFLGSSTPQITGASWSAQAQVTANIDSYTMNIPLVVVGISSRTISWSAKFLVFNTDKVDLPPPVLGCTDRLSSNYDPNANVDNNSCLYSHIPISGMFKPIAASGDVTSLTISLGAGNVLHPTFNPTIYDYCVSTTTSEFSSVNYTMVLNGVSTSGTIQACKALQIYHGSQIYYVRFLPVNSKVPVVSLNTADHQPGYYLATNKRSGSGEYSVYDKNGVTVWFFNPGTNADHVWPGKTVNKLIASASNGLRHIVKINSADLVVEPVNMKSPMLDGTSVPPAWGLHESLELSAPPSRYGNVIAEGYTTNGFYIQEQNASRNIVWEWNSSDYFTPPLLQVYIDIALDPNNPLRHAFSGTSTSGNAWLQGIPSEYLHLNSVSVHPVTGNILCSLRNCSAILCIDYNTKDVLWVLQGLPADHIGTLQSVAIPSKTANTKWLTIEGEPIYMDYQYNGTCGQHNAQWAPNIDPLTPGNFVISAYDDQSTDSSNNVWTYTGSAPRSRGVIYEINPTSGVATHRSSIFCPEGTTTTPVVVPGNITSPVSIQGTPGKSAYIGGYTVIRDSDNNYTHAIDFSQQHPAFHEYRGPIDGPKTEVFTFDLPNDHYRIVKIEPSWLRLDNLRATCGISLRTQLPVDNSIIPGIGIIPNNCQAFYGLDNISDKFGAYNLTNNGVTFSAGKVGNCAAFNGSSNLTVNAQPDYGTGDFSVSLWLKTTVTNGVLLSTTSSAQRAGGGYELLLNGAQVGFNLYWGDTGDTLQVTTTTVLNDGNWHHVSISIEAKTGYDNGFAKLYIDGVSAAIAVIMHDGGFGNGSNPTSIGSATNNTNYYTGLIDSVGIWKYPLQATDVTQLYNRGIGLEPSI
jgi:hypothetical protein